VADAPQLWERQPWDTPTSFKVLQRWLLQTRPRSLDAAYREHVGRDYYASGRKIVASDTCRYWYQGRSPKGERLFDNGQPVPTWQDRARAYDDHLAALDRERWEQRQRELREADWATGDELRDLAAQILEHAPKFLKTTRRVVKGQGGEPDQVVTTVELDGTFLLKTIKLASDIQRVAAGMPTDITEHNIRDISFTADELAAAKDAADQFEESLLDGNDDSPSATE